MAFHAAMAFPYPQEYPEFFAEFLSLFMHSLGAASRSNSSHSAAISDRRHEELGRALTGHHVAGYTGAFWPQNTGTPVADGAALRRLRRYFETVGATG